MLKPIQQPLDNCSKSTFAKYMCDRETFSREVLFIYSALYLNPNFYCLCLHVYTLYLCLTSPVQIGQRNFRSWFCVLLTNLIRHGKGKKKSFLSIEILTAEFQKRCAQYQTPSSAAPPLDESDDLKLQHSKSTVAFRSPLWSTRNSVGLTKA